jgi:hypothetical protein
MSPTTHTPRSKGRLAAVITGAGAMFVALLVVATGAVALWANSDRGHDGYVSSGSHEYQTAGRALTSPSVEVGRFTPDWLVHRVRVSATSTTSSRPVFVGIGRSRDVDAYLAGVSRSQLRDFGWDGTTFANRTGSRTPAPPATRQFWAAAASGHGTQTVSWKLKPGHWEVVVMNADGTPSVDAAVKLGAHTPPLLVPGIALVAFGLLVGAGGFAAVYRGGRPPVPPIAPAVPAVA